MAAGAADHGSPRVSVILSTYNRQATLERAITSVLAQDHPTLELLVVDDCSSDDTPDLLARWSGDDRVRVLRNEANRGLPASLNRAIRHARGAYLARIDDDDHWTDPGKLTAQLRWMASHPRGVLIGTAYVDEWGRTITNPETDSAIRRQMLLRCPFCHSSILMRAEAVAAAGGYDETLPYAEDWELWMRVGRLGTLGNLPKVAVVKARGEDTLSERYFNRQLAMAYRFAARYGRDYPGRFRARALHGFNRAFFRLFAVGGGPHRFMSRAFRRVFRLEQAGADKPPGRVDGP